MRHNKSAHLHMFLLSDLNKEQQRHLIIQIVFPFNEFIMPLNYLIILEINKGLSFIIITILRYIENSLKFLIARKVRCISNN